MRLDLRTKLSLAFIGVVIIAVGVTLWQARKTMVDLFSAEFEARVSRADSALRREYATLGADLDAALAGLGEGGGESYNPLDHLLLDIRSGALDPDRRRDFAAYLPGLMRTAGLDLLRVLSDHGRILGSGHLPGSVGDLDATGLARALAFAGETFVTDEDVRVGKGIERRMTVQVARRLERYGVAIIVIAGRILDDRLMERLGGGPAMAVTLVDPQGTVIASTRHHEAVEDWPNVAHDLRNPDGEVAARLVVAVDDSALKSSLREATRAATIVAGIGGALALLLAFGLAFRITRPLRELAAAAGKLAGGDFSRTDIPVRSRDEVGELVRAFNQMTHDLIVSSEELRRAERVAAWREIARQIAHEIKNPLSPIRTSIETLRKAKAKAHPDFDEIFEESTGTVLEEVTRLRRIVDEFSRFARMPAPRLEPVNLEEVVSSTVALYAPSAEGVTVEVKRDGDALPMLQADREQLTQVLLNLLKNAGESMAGSGQVEVELSRVDDATVGISVTDTGPGVPDEARDRLFTPYFTTKTEGTGLGLAICHRIVTDHGGTIALEPARAGEGATFAIRLPVPGEGNQGVPKT